MNNHRQQQQGNMNGQSRVGNALQSSRNGPPPLANNQQGRGLSAANTQRGPPPPQLMVTVHGPDGRVQQQSQSQPQSQVSRMQGHAPTAPLRTGHHQYSQTRQPQHHHNVQYSPTSPFSTSSDTLIGSSDSHKLSSSTNSSHSPGTTTSIRNMKLSVDPMLANSHADFENDRLASARPGGVSGGEFWKRFSTVLKDSERRMEMREKMGNNSKGIKAESEWLEKEENRGKRYRIWVGIVALLIIAGIAGGVAYHFITKEKTDGSEVADQPTTHDFGLGTDGPSSTSLKSSKKEEAEETQVESLVTPQASSVGSGFTLHDKRMAMETAVPVNIKRRKRHGRVGEMD